MVDQDSTSVSQLRRLVLAIIPPSWHSKYERHLQYQLDMLFVVNTHEYKALTISKRILPPWSFHFTKLEAWLWSSRPGSSSHASGSPPGCHWRKIKKLRNYSTGCGSSECLDFWYEPVFLSPHWRLGHYGLIFIEGEENHNIPFPLEAVPTDI